MLLFCFWSWLFDRDLKCFLGSAEGAFHRSHLRAHLISDHPISRSPDHPISCFILKAHAE